MIEEETIAVEMIEIVIHVVTKAIEIEVIGIVIDAMIEIDAVVVMTVAVVVVMVDVDVMTETDEMIEIEETVIAEKNLIEEMGVVDEEMVAVDADEMTTDAVMIHMMIMVINMETIRTVTNMVMTHMAISIMTIMVTNKNLIQEVVE